MSESVGSAPRAAERPVPRRTRRPLSPSPSSFFSLLFVGLFAALAYAEAQSKLTFWIFASVTATIVLLVWYLRKSAVRHLRTGGREAPIRHASYRGLFFVGGALDGLVIGAVLGIVLGRFIGRIAFTISMLVFAIGFALDGLRQADKELAEAANSGEELEVPSPE